MVFKHVNPAAKTWRRLKGENQLRQDIFREGEWRAR
jgi:hypothetical protein